MHALVFFILMIAVVVSLALHHHFLREMRERHPEVWESLGRPTLVLNNTGSNCFAIPRFLWRKDYEVLDDPEFARLAVFLRTFNIAYLIFFGGILIWKPCGDFRWSDTFHLARRCTCGSAGNKLLSSRVDTETSHRVMAHFQVAR
jgi:hypothetical protein